MSSVITISQPPSNPGDKGNREGPTEMTFAPMDPDVYPDDLEILVPGELAGTEPTTSSDSEEGDSAKEERAKARNSSLAKLQGTSSRSSTDNISLEVPTTAKSTTQSTLKRRLRNGPDAVIVLKEERVRFSFIMPHTFTNLFYPVGQYLSRLSQICLPSVSSPTSFQLIIMHNTYLRIRQPRLHYNMEQRRRAYEYLT